MMNSALKPQLALIAFLLVSRAWAQVPCRVTAAPTVEVPPLQLSLADVLSRETCPEMLQASAHFVLGRAPLPGSARVLERGYVEALLQQIQRREASLRNREVIVHLPERITLHRAGARTSCDEIRSQLRFHEGASVEASSCGSAGGIPRTAPLHIDRRVWDSASNSWKVFIRCTSLADCVPFVIHVRDLAPEATRVALSFQAADGTRNRADAATLTKSGQHATLLWDRDGIRLEIPAICLDNGRAGEVVRARLRSGRVVRAVVLGSGSLQIIL